MEIDFYKYHGTGNDFIIINNLPNKIVLNEEKIQLLCDRRFGIGADGLILLEQKKGVDFYMNYFNSDGKQGSMCGNGGRATVQFVHDFIEIKNEYLFLAPDGQHIAKVNESENLIHLQMKNIHQITPYENDFIINAGSPHYLKFVKNLITFDVHENGKKIRNLPAFKKEGINVNFIEEIDNYLYVSTFERGVENETLSCGTGVTASAILYKKNVLGKNHVLIKTKGGDLQVAFTNMGNNVFEDIWLIGNACYVFKGNITI